MKLNLRALVSAIVLGGSVVAGIAPAAALPVIQTPVQAAPAQAEQIHYRNYYHTHGYRPGFNVYIAPRPRYYAPRRHYAPRPAYSGHVSWCLNRYKSYNPSTNRYVSYGGVHKVCYSPYR